MVYDSRIVHHEPISYICREFASEEVLTSEEEETDAPMSRKTYRRHHEDEIEEKQRQWGCKVDVSHIVAEENGGANDSCNYTLLPSDINRSIGCRRDDIMFAYVGPERTREAVAASRQLGGCTLTTSKAQKLRKGAIGDLADILWEKGHWGIEAPDSGATCARIPEEEVEKTLAKTWDDLKSFQEIVTAWNERGAK